MGSINDEIQRVLNPIYGDKSTNHLMRLFRTDHGLLEENLWQAFLNDLNYNGSINDKMLYLFSNMESIFNESTGLYLTSASGNYVSTPDHADLDITGDICYIAKLAIPWASGHGSFKAIMGRYSGTDGVLLAMTSSGRLDLLVEGTLMVGDNLSYSDNQKGWVAITLDVDNGASDAVYTLWEGGLEDTPVWELVTSDLLGSTVSITNLSSAFEVGSSGGGGNRLIGTVYSAQIYDGIGDNSAPGLGTLVAEFDASAPVGPRYRDRTGKIWTINGSAWSWV